jgi:hypothetical protein
LRISACKNIFKSGYDRLLVSWISTTIVKDEWLGPLPPFLQNLQDHGVGANFLARYGCQITYIPKSSKQRTSWLHSLANASCHGLDHDRAWCGLCTRLDVTKWVWISCASPRRICWPDTSGRIHTVRNRKLAAARRQRQLHRQQAASLQANLCSQVDGHTPIRRSRVVPGFY